MKTDKNNDDFLKKALEKRRRLGNLRTLPQQDRELIDLTSNDYLGLARSVELNRRIEAEYQFLIQTAGVLPYIGSSGSRLLTGNRDYIESLEASIAHFHHAESCLIYNSGYVANLGLLSSIATSEDCYILDARIHASTWEGVKLSRAKTLIFQHNDILDLEAQLQKRGDRRAFICVESFYAMNGDIAPLQEISNLAEQYGVFLIVDESHATGVIGHKGKGLVSQLGLEDKIFARIHPFGKALGSQGAAVLGSCVLRDYLVNFSKAFMYTTALPLYAYVNIMCAYQYLEAADDQRLKLKQLIDHFQFKAKQLDLPIDTTNTPIQSMRLGDNEKVDHISLQLVEAGIDVRPIKMPTVRKGFECLRVCLHSFNTVEEIDLLLEQLFDKINIV